MTHPYIVVVPYTDNFIMNEDLLYLNETDGALSVIYKRVVAVHPDFRGVFKEAGIELPVWKYLSVRSTDYHINDADAPEVIAYDVGECVVSEMDRSIVEHLPSYSGNLITQ